MMHAPNKSAFVFKIVSIGIFCIMCLIVKVLMAEFAADVFNMMKHTVLSKCFESVVVIHHVHVNCSCVHFSDFSLPDNVLW